MGNNVPKVILADDLTGAMDAGMQLLDVNRRIIVIPDARTSFETHEADWVIINTDSRNLSAAQSQAAIRLTLETIRGNGQLAYKKVDSTLRGNIGAELSALLDSEGRSILFCAALPAGGRTTMHGIHYVNGKPLSSHELAKDPFSPVAEEHIAARIREQYTGKVAMLDIDMLRGGLVAKHAAQLLCTGVRVLAADAENEEDLDVLTELCQRENLLPCGSAGLICALDRVPKRAAPVPQLQGRPMLVLCGSPARICKTQLEEAAIHADHFRMIRIDPSDASLSEQRAAIEEMLDALSDGYHVALDAAADSKEWLYETLSPEELEQNRRKIQIFLNQATETAIKQASPGALMILGGDTASGILEAMGVHIIELLAPVQPLIPCGRCKGGALDGCLLITKAGGFGDKDTIWKSMEVIGL